MTDKMTVCGMSDKIAVTGMTDKTAMGVADAHI